jgi:hypothetical protein
MKQPGRTTDDDQVVASNSSIRKRPFHRFGPSDCHWAALACRSNRMRRMSAIPPEYHVHNSGMECSHHHCRQILPWDLWSDQTRSTSSMSSANTLLSAERTSTVDRRTAFRIEDRENGLSYVPLEDMPPAKQVQTAGRVRWTSQSLQRRTRSRLHTAGIRRRGQPRPPFCCDSYPTHFVSLMPRHDHETAHLAALCSTGSRPNDTLGALRTRYSAERVCSELQSTSVAVWQTHLARCKNGAFDAKELENNNCRLSLRESTSLRGAKGD